MKKNFKTYAWTSRKTHQQKIIFKSHLTTKVWSILLHSRKFRPKEDGSCNCWNCHSDIRTQARAESRMSGEYFGMGETQSKIKTQRVGPEGRSRAHPVWAFQQKWQGWCPALETGHQVQKDTLVSTYTTQGREGDASHIHMDRTVSVQATM